MKLFKDIFFMMAILPLVTFGQTVQVKKESSRVLGDQVTGYQVALVATEEEVRTSLLRYLKALGKTRETEDVLTTFEPVIAGKRYSNPLFANTRQIGSTTAAWIGMKNAGGEEVDNDRYLEKLAHDFGIMFYREKIQLQIDESLRALQTVERQQTRLISQNKDLHNKIENNKRRKIELEKSLVENKLELEDLTKKLEANSKAQDSVAMASEQIKKVLEMHREKQKNVH